MMQFDAFCIDDSNSHLLLLFYDILYVKINLA